MTLAAPRRACAGVNAMSVDVEDYFQVHALATHFPRERWDSVETRLARSVDRTLELFSRHSTRATFFILGWVAERFPREVTRIADAGHEVASHGYAHHRVTELEPRTFRSDLARTRRVLEDLTGRPVQGYRAPSYSIGETNPWAHDVLEEAGYAYSSSVYPIRHDHYGTPGASRRPFRPTATGSLLEIPVSTFEWAGRRFPCGGGGYFRLYPYGLSRWAIQRVNAREGLPAVFYFHPWEMDPEQPRVSGATARTRFRHYLNLHAMEDRLERLLSDFQWDRVDRVFAAELPRSAPEVA